MMITLGSDAEFFIVPLGTQENKIIPPIALHTDYGMPIEEFRDKKLIYTHTDGVYQPISFSVDGGACELYTQPYTNPSKLLHDIGVGLRGLGQMLSQYGFKLSNRIVGEFDVTKYWLTRNNDLDFLDCVRIGCNPDESIYQILLGQAPGVERRIEGDPLRFAGGHLQMSSPKGNPYLYVDHYIETTFLFDHLLGGLNVGIQRGDIAREDEIYRLGQYGHPGRIRLQEYPNGDSGIEYRPPSSYWVRSAENVGTKLYSLMKVIAKATETGVATKFLDEHYSEVYFGKVYSTLVGFNQIDAKTLYETALNFLLENGVVNSKQYTYFVGA